MWARCWIRCTDYRATKHEYTYRGQIMENHWFTIATNVKHIWFGWMVFQRMCAGVRLYKTLTTTFNKWLEITQISYTQKAFIFITIDWHVSEFKECRELERKNGVRQKKYWHEPSGRQQHCHNNFSEIVGIFLSFFANRQMNWLLVLTEQAQVCYVSPLCLYAKTLICRWVLPIFCLKRWACQSNGPFSAEDSHVNSVPLNVHWFVNVFAWRKLSFTNHLNG